MQWDWNVTTLVAVGALVISVAGYLRARRADHRAGAALLEARISRHPNVPEAFYGRTGITITNTGPAVASKVRVIVWEGKDDAEARAEFRGWRQRLRLHHTKGPKRLGIGAEEVIAIGITDNPEHIWVWWRDSSGLHRIHPDPRTPPRISFI